MTRNLKWLLPTTFSLFLLLTTSSANAQGGWVWVPSFHPNGPPGGSATGNSGGGWTTQDDAATAAEQDFFGFINSLGTRREIMPPRGTWNPYGEILYMTLESQEDGTFESSAFGSYGWTFLPDDLDF